MRNQCDAVVEKQMGKMVKIVAQAKGWSLEQAARITHNNAMRVFTFYTSNNLILNTKFLDHNPEEGDFVD